MIDIFLPISDFSNIHVYSSIMEIYRKILVLLAVLVFFLSAFLLNKVYEDSAYTIAMNAQPKCDRTSVPYDLKLCMKNNSCPNIVYMLVDDVGYGDVEYNGGQALTPHLNAMAKGPHSIHLTRFYAGGPVCSPTRGTILTGRNHNRYCIWHADIGVPKVELTCPSLGPLPSSEITIAEMLKEHGYHTSFYGKWHVGDLKPIPGGNVKWPVSHPGMNGFTDWLVTERHTASLLPNCKCSSQYSCTIDGHPYSPFTCRNYLSMNPYTGKLEKYPGQVFEDSHFLVDRLKSFSPKEILLSRFFLFSGFIRFTLSFLLPHIGLTITRRLHLTTKSVTIWVQCLL